jgi:hypothetical protein
MKLKLEIADRETDQQAREAQWKWDVFPDSRREDGSIKSGI